MPTKQLLADAADSQPTTGSSPAASPQQQQEQQPQPLSETAANDAEGDSIWSTSKPPGRMSTAHTIGLDPHNKADRAAGYNKDELRKKRRSLLGWASGLWGGSQQQQQPAGHLGRALRQSDTRVTSLLEAGVLWKQGFSGKGIKVGSRVLGRP
jgi:hypothetical protein